MLPGERFSCRRTCEAGRIFRRGQWVAIAEAGSNFGLDFKIPQRPARALIPGGEQVAAACVVLSDSHRKTARHVLQDETRSGTVPP